MPNLPAYFLTWTTYGTWLHGDHRGSVDDTHNQRHTPWLSPNAKRYQSRSAQLNEDTFILNERSRSSVHSTIERVCKIRQWELHAINVRSNHVHIVVSASSHTPEQVISQLKSWCTRDLIESGFITSRERLWTKMGSTRWINDEKSLIAAIDYVLNHQ